MDDKIPCIDCISLPICRSKIQHEIRHKSISAMWSLMHMCSIIDEYVYNEDEMPNTPEVKDVDLLQRRKKLNDLMRYLSGDNNIKMFLGIV